MQSQYLKALLSPSTLHRVQCFFGDRLGKVQLLKVLVSQFAQSRPLVRAIKEQCHVGQKKFFGLKGYIAHNQLS